jgi:hypothetical protein
MQMIEKAGDSRELFFRYYEKYFVAKEDKNRKLLWLYALYSVAQIHHIAGGADPKKATQVIHELFGGILTEEQAIKMYQELYSESRPKQKRFTLTFEDAPVEPLKNYIRKASTCASEFWKRRSKKFLKC